MNTKNQQVVFTAPGEAQLLELPIPVLKPNEALIRNSKTVVSIGTELTAFNAQYEEGSTWADLFAIPYHPGYMGVGEVIEVGSEVDKNWIGEKVAHRGTHSAFAVQPVDDEHVYKIHRDIPDEYAALFAIPRIVMNGVRRSGAKWGDSVAIYGAGLLGQFAARFCRLLGALPVFVMDTSDFRLNLLPDDNLLLPLNPERDDVEKEVRAKTSGRMADIVFEITGNQNIISQEFSVLRPQGVMVMLSSPPRSVDFDFHDFCNRHSYTIIGAHNASHPPYSTPDNPWTQKRHVEFFFDLLADGQLDISRLITRTASYKEAPGIYSDLQQDRSKEVGVVFDWNE